MFYSVIIPVYNARNYLAECINSILRFKNDNFELIAINDGSTDDSLDILNSYNDSRLKIINQENMGQYKSWKNAVKVAKGDYIIFVDSDDLIENNIFDISDTILNKNNVDLIQYRYQSLYPSKIEEYNFNIRTGLYLKDDLLNLHDNFNDFLNIPRERWAKAIRKNKLLYVIDHSFDYLDNFEDVAAIYVLLKNIDSLYISNEIIYSWRKKKGGNKSNIKASLDKNFKLIKELNVFFNDNKNNLNLNQKDLDYLYLLTYKNYYYFYAYNGYYKDSKKIYKDKKFKYLLKHSKLDSTKGNKIINLIYKLSNFFLKHNMMHTYIFIRKLYIKNTNLFEN